MFDPDESDFYQLDNLHLLSVGVDVGSSTSHLMFSQVHLQRLAEGMSSRYVVVDRRVLWKSDVWLTPYLEGGWIDAEKLAELIANCYVIAGIDRREVDGGAVVLTGEALKRQNARALAEAVAEGTGNFVCVSAGHHLEAMLSVYGSGAMELSSVSGDTILSIDIGGGTTKLSLIHNSQVVATAALEIGARMATWESDRQLSALSPTLAVLGFDLDDFEAKGSVNNNDERVLAEALVNRIFAIASRRPGEIEESLWLTDVIPGHLGHFDAIVFCGGVSEYIYGRETRSFGDLGKEIGNIIRAKIDRGEFVTPVLNPGEGIRATVIGASQSSLQVSGSTVAVSESALLPIRNIPVLHPKVDLSGEYSSVEIARSIKDALTIFEIDGTVALAFNFGGPPSYVRLKLLADGIAAGLDAYSDEPVVILFDNDIGASLGSILKNETEVKCSVICLDNLQLKPFNYVDIGRPIMPSGVFPVVIKSLLFGSQT